MAIKVQKKQVTTRGGSTVKKDKLVSGQKIAVSKEIKKYLEFYSISSSLEPQLNNPIKVKN